LKIKLETIVEKTAKNFRGYFILPHPVENLDKLLVCRLVGLSGISFPGIL